MRKSEESIIGGLSLESIIQRLQIHQNSPFLIDLVQRTYKRWRTHLSGPSKKQCNRDEEHTLK